MATATFSKTIRRSCITFLTKSKPAGSRSGAVFFQGTVTFSIRSRRLLRDHLARVTTVSSDLIVHHFPYKIETGRITCRSSLFPGNSHIQYSLTQTPPGSFGAGNDGQFHNPGPEGWLKFLDQTGFEYTVLFPTHEQRIGRLVDRDYAVGVARVYNEWLAETYLQRDRRFKGIALLPLHDAEAALEELRYACTKLGMSGVLFPATGVHLNLGAKQFWPLYAEAARLGCPVVVHGGGHWDLGMDTMNVSTGANAIGQI